MRINLAFDTAFHVVDDELVFVAGGEGDAQELGWVDVLLTEELAVATSAVHQVGGQSALQFGTGLDNQARQPGDAGDLVGLTRELRHLLAARGRLANEIVEKTITAHGLQFLNVLINHIAPVHIVIAKIQTSPVCCCQ